MEEGRFCSPRCDRTCPGAVAAEVKRPERQDGQSPQSVAEITKVWSFISTYPYVFVS